MCITFSSFLADTIKRKRKENEKKEKEKEKEKNQKKRKEKKQKNKKDKVKEKDKRKASATSKSPPPPKVFHVFSECDDKHRIAEEADIFKFYQKGYVEVLSNRNAEVVLESPLRFFPNK